jgi:hypothetical protein
MSALLERALMTLKAMNAQFKVIMPDGQEFGDLEIAQKTEKRRVFKYPRGTMQNFVRGFLMDMAVGDLVEIKCDDFELAEIQTAACNYALMNWGKGSIMTAQNQANNTIEAIRLK